MKTARAILIVLSIILAAAAALSQMKQKPQKRPLPAPGKGNPVVVMKTSLGDIRIELFQDKAPVTVKNFLAYVDEKFYDSTVFHRVIKTFMIQGGGFAATDPPRQKRTKDPIINESTNGVSNDSGTIAMARTPDPNSATSQFFINVVNNKNLNRGAMDPNGYAVFGRVVGGMDVVDKIKNVTTGQAPLRSLAGDQEIEDRQPDVPVTKVVIVSVRREAKK